MDEQLQQNNCSKAIKPINTDTVHKICSGQVVLSLAVAVKELVENSLDAGATIIEIRFKNYGIELIEVSDNGSGVAEANFMAMTLKHHTSKLSEYSDLLGVSSFGFRGEALSSLCALANIIITTKHQASDYASKLEYDHNGQIVKKTLCSRQVGTTICLSNLFYSLPVRQKEFHKNVKREFNKMTQLLYAYCLISLGVKITCTNQINSNSKTTVVSTTGSMSYKDNIASIFGIKQLQSLLEIKPEYVTNIKDNIFKGLSQEVQEIEESVTLEDIEIDLSEDSNDADPNKDKDDSISISQRSKGYKNEVCPIEFTGFISTCAHGSGRSSTDRQFFYVNSRPCEPTKVIKIINEVYKQYNPNQYPFLFLNINLDRNTVDVNVTPDKRKIFLTKEKIVLDILKNSLHKLFENIPKYLKIEGAYRQQINDIKPDITQPRIFNSFLSQFNKKPEVCSSSSHDRHENKSSELKRKNTSITEYITSKLQKPAENATVNDVEENNYEEVESETSKTQCNTQAFPKTNMNVGQEEIDEDTIIDNKEIIYLESTDNLPCTQIRNISDVVIEKSHTTTCKTKTTPQRPNISNFLNERPAKKPKVVTDKEDLGKINRATVNLKTSIEQVKALTEMYNEQKATTAPDRIKFKSTINPVFNKKCEEELSKEISKESFKNMEVIGQFNLGFIITRLEDDLFIIDQHATDEIYNFETLQKTTELTNQKLVIPQQLELTGVNEEILIDNLEIFKKNGFTFEINPEAPLTKRVKLLTIPMSKNWVFGKEDIEELLFMLRESPSEYCRPSRVRAMFASRACRKSVMIGTALAKADMKKLVDHMAEIDKPWNCPHGRPTIRHLVNLAMVNTKREAE